VLLPKVVGTAKIIRVVNYILSVKRTGI